MLPLAPAPPFALPIAEEIGRSVEQGAEEARRTPQQAAEVVRQAVVGIEGGRAKRPA